MPATGVANHKNYSGKFNVRLDPKDRAAAALTAAAEGKNLNEWVAGTIRQAIAA